MPCRDNCITRSSRAFEIEATSGSCAYLRCVWRRARITIRRRDAVHAIRIRGRRRRRGLAVSRHEVGPLMPLSVLSRLRCKRHCVIRRILQVAEQALQATLELLGHARRGHAGKQPLNVVCLQAWTPLCRASMLACGGHRLRQVLLTSAGQVHAVAQATCTVELAGRVAKHLLLELIKVSGLLFCILGHLL